jgi:hypothetical protein
MTSGWTAKADAATEIITWLALVIGALILVLWFFRSGIGSTSDVEVLDKDLVQLQIMLDEACSSMSYRNTFNPMTESGYLIITDEVCVRISQDNESKVTRCIMPLCAVDAGMIDLNKMTRLVITRNRTVAIDAR